MADTDASVVEILSVTHEEAARLLSVSKTTIRRLCANGSLKEIILGRSVRVSIASIQHVAQNGASTKAKKGPTNGK